MTEAQLHQFEAEGWVAIPDFLPQSEAAAISLVIDQLAEAGELREAAIGRGSGQQVISHRRGDFIQWIDPEQAGPAVSSLLDRLEDLRLELNRHFYLGIRNMETHLTRYPPGTRYEKHVDRHRTGSPRLVSLVCYLNEGWKAGDGGELVIWHERGGQATIEPRMGTLAIFLSELEHEVLETNVVRRSVTGWMRKDDPFLG